MRFLAPSCALALLAAGCGHVGYDGEVNNSIPPSPPGQVQGASSGAGTKVSDLPSSYPQPKNSQAEPAAEAKPPGENTTPEEGKPAEAPPAVEEPNAGEEPKTDDESKPAEGNPAPAKEEAGAATNPSPEPGPGT
jgi:hypothetical protein